MQSIAWGVGHLAAQSGRQSQRMVSVLPCPTHVLHHLKAECRVLTDTYALYPHTDPPALLTAPGANQCLHSDKSVIISSHPPLGAVASNRYPWKLPVNSASQGSTRLCSCTAASRRTFGTEACFAPGIEAPLKAKSDPSNDVTKLLKLIRDAPLNRSSWDADIGDVSRMLKGNAGFARQFSEIGGVQSLVKMLERGKLSVYLSDLPIAVSLSAHFPADSLVELGFMEALVLGLQAKVTSGTPAPFVRDSICRAIQALLEKQAAAGARPGTRGSAVSAAQQAVDAGLLRPLGDMMRNEVSLIDVAGVVAGLALSGDQWRARLLDAGFLHELLRHMRMLQLRLFDPDSADGRTNDACGRALAVLCTAGDPQLRSAIVVAGVVQPLLQLAIVGSPPAVQGPVYEALQVLSRSPEVRRQIMNARIRQDWNLTPQAWNSWWHDLALRCSLTEH